MTHETRRGRPERFATDGTYLDIGGLKIYEQVISDDNPDRDSGPEAEEPQDGAEEAHIRRYPTSPESPDTFEIGGKEEAGKDTDPFPDQDKAEKQQSLAEAPPSPGSRFARQRGHSNSGRGRAWKEEGKRTTDWEPEQDLNPHPAH